LVDTAPETLDTLNELAAALGDDPNFATTVTNSIAGKVSLTGDQTVAGVKTFSNNSIFDGNVGIGTSTPRAGVKLDVASTGEAVISVTDLDQANTWGNFSHNNGLTQFISRNGDSFGSFVWYGADGSTFPERMRIDSSGKVGIGVSSTPINASLQIGKGITSGPPAAGANTAAACFGNDTSQNAYGLVMGADGFGKGYISAQRTDGTATTYSLLLQPNGGNTGIGTINPGAPLEVRRDGTGQTVIARFSNHNTDVHFLNLKVDDASNLVIYDSTGYSSGGHVFQAGGAERMRITSSGNVGIGTSSPTAPLDTAGVRIGRNFSLTGRATVRLDSANTSSPSDVLFGHTAAANQDGWNGVYWSLSSRASENNNRFALFRGAGNPGGGGEAIVMIWEPNGSVLPGTNATQDLGSASLRWNTVYTSDLSLKNDHGDWTIVEGEDDLFLYNNKKNKVYKFALTEVDPSIAPAKRD
jgi:hypothetical protein